jgi:glycosyltransferase involved in cell wall biosynthesis
MFMQTQAFFGADSGQHALIMRNLDRSDWRVHVACNAGERDLPSASLQAVRRIPDVVVRPLDFARGFRSRSSSFSKLGATVLQAPRLALTTLTLGRYVRKERIRVVHATEKPRDVLVGYIAAKLGGAHLVVHVHVKAETWINAAVRWVMRRCELIAISNFVRDSLVELGYRPDRIHVVLNGMDTDRWEDQLGGVDDRGWNERDETEDVRREFGVDHDDLLLTCVGRLNPWKGQLDLVKALAIVRQTEPRFKALIIGEPDEVGPDSPRFFDLNAARRLVDELGLADRVTFTGYRRDVPRLMGAGDIYAMPSFEEPFGMVFLEAMALRKPVVALANGGTQEVVDHEVTGLLSPPGDLEALAANIVRLIRDADLRRRLGEAGRDRLETMFRASRVGEETAAVYRHILAAQRVRSASSIANTRLRVLYLTDQTALGGDTRAELLTLRELDPDAFEVDVVCPPHGQTLAAFSASTRHMRVRPISLGADRGGSILQRLRSIGELAAGSLRIARIALRTRPDVVIAGDRPRSIAAGLLATRAGRTRFVYHPQYFWNPYDFQQHVQRRALARADLVICHSKHSADSFAAMGCPRVKLRVAHNPVDVQGFRPGDSRAARAELGIRGQAWVVGTTSVMRAEKGHAVLIDAVASLADTVPELHLLLVGDGPMRPELEAQCRRRGIEKRVTFTGRLDDTSSAYRALDVFVMPSEIEPFGLVTIEAMATGLPVIGTNTGGTPEIVIPNVTGLLIPPGDVAALANAMYTLWANRERSAELGMAGRARALEFFSAETRSRTVAAQLSELVVAQRRASPAAEGTTT